MKYIIIPGKALSTKRGIISAPKDIENPKQENFITEKDFKDGKEIIDRLLKAKCIRKWENEIKKKKIEKENPVNES